MKRFTSFLITILVVLFLTRCAGIKYLTVETHEPAKVTLPSSVLSVVVVNNAVQQPDNVGHNILKIGHTVPDRTTASSDSIDLYFTEALAQFMDEEDYFQKVLYHTKPLRNDHDFFLDIILDPDTTLQIIKDAGVNAVISLDRLQIQTDLREHFRQQGYMYGDMKGKIEATVRVYLPTLDGKIPVVKYTDSLHWEGFDIRDEMAYADALLPSREEAMKILAVGAAEKLTRVFIPHWERQERWYYLLPDAGMREGEAYISSCEWSKAIEKWESFYNASSKLRDKAKAATNIAFAYEMEDELGKALEWATTAYNLFMRSTPSESLDRRRALLYKNEMRRRNNLFEPLRMEDD